MISDEFDEFDEFYQILEQIEKVQGKTFKILEFDSRIIKNLEMGQENQKEKYSNTLKCQFCMKSCSDPENLNYHNLGAHKTKALFYGPTKYSCRICFKEFKGVLNLILHERNTQHPEKCICIGSQM